MGEPPRATNQKLHARREEPREIPVRPWRDGVRVAVPPYRSGLLVPAGVGWFGATMIVFITGWAIGNGRWLYASVGIFTGVILIAIALWLFVGGKTLFASRERFGIRYHLGPLGFTYWFKPGEVTGFRAREAASGGSRGEAKIDAAPYELKLLLGGGKGDDIVLAESDAPEPLMTLGERLAEATGGELKLAKALKPASDETNALIASVDDAVVPDPPEGCSLLLEREDGRLTLLAPPTGFTTAHAKSSLAIGVIGCVVIAFVAFIFGGQMTAAFNFVQNFGIVMAFILIGAIALGMLVHALDTARRRVIIDLADGHVMLTRQGLGGVKQRAIPAGRVREVRVGHSGQSTEQGAIKQLQIVPKRGPWVRTLTGYGTRDLKWAATALRAGLGL